MCGIIGSLATENSAPVNKKLIVAMRDTMVHRGPDADGIYIRGNIGLGHRRLSILDLENGHQPMVSPDGRFAIVHNGEVYNFREIRRELQSLGHAFQTDCDTEVILKAYMQWGSACVDRFNGMFAFAIWDDREQILILIRDRLGIKPLYWTRIDGVLFFASEIKAFLAHPGFNREVDLDALSSYLTFRQAVWDLCFFKNVHKVLPGTAVTFATDGHSNCHTYWTLPKAQPRHDLNETELLDSVEEQLQRAVERRMIADVPVGAFLSGGLDSSLVSAMMAKVSPGRVKTFSIGYGTGAYNEEPFAKTVADHIGSDHTFIRLQEQDVLGDWIDLINKRSAPLSIPHEPALYRLSQAINKDVTVVLSGEGADELFGGYGRVQRSPMDWKKILVARRILGPRIASQLAKTLAVQPGPLGTTSHLDHFLSVYNWIPLKEKWDIFTSDALRSLDGDRRTLGILETLFDALDDISPYDRVLHIFQKIHLGCLLDRLDMMSMFASLEARVPFVDHELVESVVNIPVKYKLRWNSILSRLRAVTVPATRASEWLDTNKYMLRQIGTRHLPRDIAYRKKLGFPTPLDTWMENGMKDTARDVLFDRTTRERGIFDVNKLTLLIDNPQKLPYDFYGKKIWMLMNIELWFRNVIDQKTQ